MELLEEGIQSADPGKLLSAGSESDYLCEAHESKHFDCAEFWKYVAEITVDDCN